MKPKNFEEWKTLHNVKPDQKVFQLIGGYRDIRQALLNRDWAENTDKESHYFDFRWAVKARDCTNGNIKDNQIVNHFAKNGKIVSKIGLTHTLKELTCFTNLSSREIYPNCFHLNTEEDFEDFKCEFKVAKAIGVVK